MSSNTEWPPAEEAEIRAKLAGLFARMRQEAEEGLLTARGAERRDFACQIVLDATARAAENYSFLRGLLLPDVTLPADPTDFAIMLNLMSAEVRELATLHETIADHAEQRGEADHAWRRRERAGQLRELIGEGAP